MFTSFALVLLAILALCQAIPLSSQVLLSDDIVENGHAANPDDMPIATHAVSTTTTTSTSTVPTATSNAAILQQLQLASSEIDRLKILLPNPSNPANITYTFVNNTVSPPTGGTISLSSVDGFPALVGTQVAMAIGFVNACGLNTPHSHPRANEFLTVVQGKLQAGFILEGNPGGAGNVPGADPTTLMGALTQVNTTLTPYMGTLFPQGSVHFQFNPTCEPAVFAAAFDNNDPGRAQIARVFFSLRPNEVIRTAVGDGEVLHAKDINVLRDHIPSSFAELIESCAKRCGII